MFTYLYSKHFRVCSFSQKNNSNNSSCKFKVSSPSLLLPHHFILQVSSLIAGKGLRSLNWPWPANMWFTVDDIVLEKQNFCPEAKLHLMINISAPGPSSGIFTNTVHYFNSSWSSVDFGGTLPKWVRFTIWINIQTCATLIYCPDFEDKIFDHLLPCLQICL